MDKEWLIKMFTCMVETMGKCLNLYNNVLNEDIMEVKVYGNGWNILWKFTRNGKMKIWMRT